MIVQYYELSAMVGVGQPGRRVVLNDLHKTAWSLYTGTGEMTIPKNTERPFTFRADTLPGQPGRFIFVIRSPFPFAHATAKTVDLSQGNSLRLEMVFSPYRRASNVDKGRRYVPPESEWDDVTQRRMRAAGLTPDAVMLERLPSMSMRPNQVRLPVVIAEVSAMVADPVQAANTWLRGATMMRAYGMGQLTLLPDSHTQAIAV